MPTPTFHCISPSTISTHLSCRLSIHIRVFTKQVIAQPFSPKVDITLHNIQTVQDCLLIEKSSKVKTFLIRSTANSLQKLLLCQCFSFLLLAVCWQTEPGASNGCSAVGLNTSPLYCLILIITCWNKTNKQQPSHLLILNSHMAIVICNLQAFNSSYLFSCTHATHWVHTQLDIVHKADTWMSRVYSCDPLAPSCS